MLKRSFVVALMIGLPGNLPAQGMVTPVPCTGQVCAPMPCPAGRVCNPGPANIIHVSSAANVQLNSGVLKFVINEEIRNTGSANGEVDYMFPLPKFAAFQDLAMSVNGEMMAGEVLPADRARTIYESIVRARRDPALVEWMGHGLLRTRIFPIQPGELKSVEVRLQAVAQREGDAIRVDYFVGTRRGQAGGPNGTTTTLTFSYPDSARYGTPYSPTHSISNSKSANGTRTVTLSGTGSEITLLLPVRNTRTASISVVSHATSAEPGFALITLSPPQLPPRVTPRDVVFVLDVSGSMVGTKLAQGKQAGKQVLSTLRATDRFRIVNFGTDVSSFSQEFVVATPQNVSRANAYLDSLEATGSTNIMGALEEALSSFRGQSADRLPLVLFVTDGAPTIGESRSEVIAQRTADLRGRARVFTFGVGTDVKAELIEELALEGRGTAQMVSINESVERAVSVVASRLTAPIVTDLRLRSDGVRIDRMHPSDVSDLFAGQDVIIMARYNGSGRTTLNFEGTSADGPVRWSTSVDLPERQPGNGFVSRLWATQRVGFLSAERRRNGANPELDREIRELGERYSIPTLFTSYMVIEPGVNIGPDGRVTNALDFAGRGVQGQQGQQGQVGRAGGAAAASGAVGRGAGGGGGRGGAASGADAVIQIRNPLSVSGFTQPMIVIDGVIQIQDATAVNARAVNGTPPNLTADKIESVEIVRGAAAAALYGQRAANGVIEITTKDAAAKMSKTTAADSTGRTRAASLASALQTLQRPAAAQAQARQLTAHETVTLDETMRRARSEADLEQALSSGRSKRIGDRMFALIDSTWIDARHSDSLTVTKIKPYSEVYFELLKSVPSLNPVFALGDKVLVAGKTVSILLDEKGVEKLTREQIDAFVKKW